MRMQNRISPFLIFGWIKSMRLVQKNCNATIYLQPCWTDKPIWGVVGETRSEKDHMEPAVLRSAGCAEIL